MRGWSSFVAGFLLLALGYWLYSLDGFGYQAAICGIAAAAFFLQGAFGLGIDAGGGATGLVEFIQNPADAIVDSATDKLADWVGTDEPQTTAAQTASPALARIPGAPPSIAVEPPKIAPDAMDRYFAQREAELAAAAASGAPAPLRSFGRKGL